jgi:hypothetical protein
MTGKVLFTLDARMEAPFEERSLVDKYRRGSLVIYDSIARQAHSATTAAHLESTRDQSGYRTRRHSELTNKILPHLKASRSVCKNTSGFVLDDNCFPSPSGEEAAQEAPTQGRGAISMTHEGPRER